MRGRPELWVRSAYWWGSAATVCLMPYLAIYYRDLGFTGGQIGLLLAIQPLGPAVMAPLWGRLADAFGAHRLLLWSLLPAAALIGLLLYAASAYLQVFVLMVLLAVVMAPVGSLLDSFSLTIAERRGRSYGSLRIWGSLGYIGAAWVVGRWLGGAVSRQFFVAYSVCVLLAFVSALGLPRLSVRRAVERGRGIRALLADRSVLLLLVTAYLVWSSTSIMYNYVGLHITRLGGDSQIVGAAFALSALSELPVFAFGGWLLSHIGARRMLGLAIAGYALRFLVIGVLPSASWVLPVQLMHSITYGFFVLASVTLIHRLASQELAATGQGLLSSASIGFGMITGSLVGGALLDVLGTAALFLVASGIALLALLVYLAGLRLYAGVFAARPEPALATE